METSEKDRLLPDSPGGRCCIQETMEPNERTSGQINYSWEKMRKLPPGKSSFFGAVFVVINAALGAGLLTFPFAFNSAGGVVEGISIEFLLVVFVFISMLILGYTAEVKQADTYEDAVSAVWGPAMRIFVELCIFFYCFGASIAYLAVIGDQLDDIAAAFNLSTPDSSGTYHPLWFVDRRFTITIAALFFISPWLWMRRIGVLSYISFLAVVCCVYIALAITIKYFTDDRPYLSTHNCTTSVTSTCDKPSWPDIFNAVPFICFAYQCHVSCVPVYADLKQRNLKVFSGIIAVGISICVFIYTLTGAFGYLNFEGHCYNSDILRNYCPRDIYIDVARGLLALVMVTSYPIPAYCGRTALDSLLMKLFRLCKIDKKLESFPGTKWRVEGVVWLLITLALAIFVPEISYVLNPIGGLAGTFIFVFPGLCLLKLTLDSRSLSAETKSLLVLGAVVITAVGAFIFGNSVIYSILKDTHVIQSR